MQYFLNFLTIQGMAYPTPINQQIGGNYEVRHHNVKRFTTCAYRIITVNYLAQVERQANRILHFCKKKNP